MSQPLHMSNRRRDLILRVSDGQPNLLPILFMFQKLRRCDECLQWLVENKITGRNFVAWFDINGKSPLESMTIILARLNKEKDRRVLAHRDFLVG